MNDTRRIDLHAHTVHSDGTFTATELVEEAHRFGLAGLAVTDHDTTTALAEAHEVGTRLGVTIFDGCEISTSIPTGIVHILTYGFDVEHDELQAFLGRVRGARDERNDRMFARLEELGVPLEREDVQRLAHGRIVARPHFARAMVTKGYVHDIREAFSKYLRDGGPAYVPAHMPSPEEAIEVATRAGGACVLAHPKQLRLGKNEAYRPVVRSMVEAGLVGIEIDHPTHKPEDRDQFRTLATELNLVCSGGSDFHGAAKPHIRLGEGDGTIHVTWATWDALRAALAA